MRRLSPAASIVRVFGRTDARRYDFECDPIQLGPQHAAFRTRSDPSHTIEVTPRYVGGSLDKATAGLACTICAFTFDGDYVAIADYYRLQRGLLIVPYDYSPSWQYGASQQELAEFGSSLDRIKRELSS